jgi:cellulose synthase/poly-beta-1,6-N-acetylglucosamine synthase-like glycosyltransferase
MGLEPRQWAALGRIEVLLRHHVATQRPLRQYPEFDCVRALFDSGTVEAIERRARKAGVGADRVLVANGLLDEEDYVRALAASIGVPFEPLERIDRTQCPLGNAHLIAAPAAGMIPLLFDGKLNFIVAPRAFAARRMAQRGGPDPNIPGPVRLTTAQRLDAFVRMQGETALAEHATGALQWTRPELSASPSRTRRSTTAWLIAAAIGMLALITAPGVAMLALEIALAMIFLAWMLLRVAGTLVKPPPRRAGPMLSDAELPTYSVLVSLYHEVAAVPGLVDALQNLDYPREKLDIKFVTEPDDVETRAAIEAHRLGPQFEIFVAPAGEPRTKPKALNAALPFARGSFTVIYDAEDRPEPDQLRRALEAFRQGGADLACVQASLTIDNAADNWLTGFFAAEYAGHFDVFLPALALFEQPLPLGGSSNHFRTQVLRDVGAWDPYNVTEDADLGLRLARFGYRTSTIDSATYEEAPARFGPWLKQRTRWFKGWMKTWLVHMREPLRLRREIGTAAFITVHLIVGGNVLGALVHPLLLLLVGLSMFRDAPILGAAEPTAFFAVMAVAGYFASALPCLVGLARRGLIRYAAVLPRMPVYWLMLSLAAWRALYQLIRDPYRWEKTEHGLARTSRMTKRPSVIPTVTASSKRASYSSRQRRPALPRRSLAVTTSTNYGTMIEKLTALEKV